MKPPPLPLRAELNFFVHSSTNSSIISWASWKPLPVKTPRALLTVFVRIQGPGYGRARHLELWVSAAQHYGRGEHGKLLFREELIKIIDLNSGPGQLGTLACYGHLLVFRHLGGACASLRLSHRNPHPLVVPSPGALGPQEKYSHCVPHRCQCQDGLHHFCSCR